MRVRNTPDRANDFWIEQALTPTYRRIKLAEIDIALAQLEGVRKIAGGYQAKCPCHNDKHQSLSIAEKGGKLMLYCPIDIDMV